MGHPVMYNMIFNLKTCRIKYPYIKYVEIAFFLSFAIILQPYKVVHERKNSIH